VSTEGEVELDEPRVPNLEEMDEQQAHQFLTDLYSRHIPQEEYDVRHPEDYVMEMPQSGERFRGRENMRNFQEAHPTPPSSLQARRVLVREGLWVVEGVIDYGDGRVFDVVLISSSSRTGRCGETGGTSRSPLRRLSGESSGSSGWNPEARQAHLDFRER
jgi:hypothetical protein